MEPQKEIYPEPHTICQHNFDYSKCSKIQMFECDYCELNPKKESWFKNAEVVTWLNDSRNKCECPNDIKTGWISEKLCNICGRPEK